MFIDHRTDTVRPALLPVRWMTYFRSRPVWLFVVGLAYVAPIVYSFVSNSNAWALATLALTALLGIRLRTIHGLFGRGRLCPATVISRNPLLVGVLTDLASDPETTRPALKVFAPGASKNFLALGTRLAAISTYSGRSSYGHWENCHAHLAITANDEPRVQQGLLDQINPREWVSLERACDGIPFPPKCGLYPLVLLAEEEDSTTLALASAASVEAT